MFAKRFGIRMFAPDGGSSGGGAPASTPQGDSNQTQVSQSGSVTAPQFDYDKLASIIAGKQTVTEDTILKNYFKQQGLSQDEARQAMEAFRQQKAASQPDISTLQAQATQAQAAAQQAALDKEATLAAIGLGIDVKTVPYVLKMADLSQAMGQDGKINEEALKTAINKVLEDVPSLKPAPASQTGFVQVGATGGTGQQTTDEALKKAFGLK